MKEQLFKKLRYYKTQEKSWTKRFLESNKRTDRDVVIKITGKIDLLKELLKDVIEDEKKAKINLEINK